MYICFMKNYMNDYIFPSFLTSAEVEGIENWKILHECYRLKHIDPEGLHKSNLYGWHSKLYSNDNIEDGMENLNNLCQAAWSFGDEVLRIHNLNKKISKITYWVNISPQYTYNVLHSHPKADISVVYYAKVEEGAGSLMLLRNDGSMHTSLYENRPEMLRFEVKPVVGRFYAFPSFLLHHVLNNLSEEDRISIAFNLTI